MFFSIIHSLAQHHQHYLEQGCGVFVKMTQLRLRSSSFHEHGSGSSSGALGFHECGSVSGALIFQASGFSSVFCSFSHINIFNCLGVPQVEWKMNYNKYTKLKEYTTLFK